MVLLTAALRSAPALNFTMTEPGRYAPEAANRSTASADSGTRGVRSGSRTTSWSRKPRSIAGRLRSDTSARAAVPDCGSCPAVGRKPAPSGRRRSQRRRFAYEWWSCGQPVKCAWSPQLERPATGRRLHYVPQPITAPRTRRFAPPRRRRASAARCARPASRRGRPVSTGPGSGRVSRRSRRR